MAFKFQKAGEKLSIFKVVHMMHYIQNLKKPSMRNSAIRTINLDYSLKMSAIALKSYLFFTLVTTGDNDVKPALIHYNAKSIGSPLLMNRFDYFSNFYEYKS